MTIKFQIGIDPELFSILRTLAAAAGGLGINAVQIEAEGALMIQQLQTLTDQVTANNSLVASAVQLIGGLAAQIEASKTDPVALQALADSLKQNDDALTAAVLANTPAEPPTPPAADPAPAPAPADPAPAS